MTSKHNDTQQAGELRALGHLIERLGPLNNACRLAEGIDKVELLWDMGETLLQHMPQASDQLLWNIRERSYLTRDILRYALIIRRAWTDRAELRRLLPRLRHYTLFREALPFLKGDGKGVSKEVVEDVIGRLNGNAFQETKAFLTALKGRTIGRKHKKGQAAARMSHVAKQTSEAIQTIIDSVGAGKERVAALRDSVAEDALLILSQWCMTIAEGKEQQSGDIDPSGLAGPFATLAANLLLVSRAGRDCHAGFLKALGPLALMEAADLLNALRSDPRLEQWRQRRGLRLTV